MELHPQPENKIGILAASLKVRNSRKEIRNFELFFDTKTMTSEPGLSL
jgi:hypothetical protein